MNKRRLSKAIGRLLNLPKGKYLFLYFKNKGTHYYHKLRKSKEVAYPSNVMLELTNHCNLACTTCPREYEYGKDMDKGNMLVERAKIIIDDIWPYLDSIGLTGMGETFLYQNIEEIVDYIKKKNKGIIISVSTNAVIPNFIQKVSKVINKIDTIQISIDGLGETYESIRLKSNFEILDENIRQLVALCAKSSTTTMLNMVVTKENYFQMSDLVKYANEVGIKYLDFSQLNLAAVTNIDVSYYKFYQSNEFLDAIEKLEVAIKEYDKVTITYNFKTETGFQKCPFPWSHFYICWDGYIAPCCAKPFPKLLNFGNVSDDKLINLLNNEEYRGFRTLWFNNKTPEFCNKCHFTVSAK